MGVGPLPAEALPAVALPAVALPAVTLPVEALPAEALPALPDEALRPEAFDFGRRPLRSMRSTASTSKTPLLEYSGMLGCRQRLRCWCAETKCKSVFEPKWLRKFQAVECSDQIGFPDRKFPKRDRRV